MLKTEEHMYMDGVGIHKRTRELNSAVWDSIEGAILGSTLASLGPIFGGVALVVFWESPPWQLALIMLAAIASLLIGLRMGRRHREAHRAVKEHTARMKAETEKRGEGWAES